MNDLSDEQWILLDIFMRAREKGVHSIHRREILYSPGIPQSVAVKLTFNMLLMADKYIKCEDHEHFSIMQEGIDLYNIRFGHGKNAKPTEIANTVICLPDLSNQVLQ